MSYPVSRDSLVQLNTFIGPDGLFTAPANISAALDGSALGGNVSDGLPLDWIARGPVSGDWPQAIRKAGGGGLIAISRLGTDGASLLQDRSGGSFGGSVSWTDGPSGHVTGTADGNVQELGSSDFLVAPNGWQIQVAAPMYPDWRILKLWERVFPGRNMSYTAALNDSASTSQSQALAGNSGPISAYTANALFTFEVKFASIEPGRTLTVSMVAGYQFQLGLFGAALYRAEFAPKPPRGFARFQALAGAVGNPGAR